MANNKYPWDKWFAKKRFKIYWGKDFDCMPHSMAVHIRQTAVLRDLTVSIMTYIEDNGETYLLVEVL